MLRARERKQRLCYGHRSIIIWLMGGTKHAERRAICAAIMLIMAPSFIRGLQESWVRALTLHSLAHKITQCECLLSQQPADNHTTTNAKSYFLGREVFCLTDTEWAAMQTKSLWCFWWWPQGLEILDVIRVLFAIKYSVLPLPDSEWTLTMGHFLSANILRGKWTKIPSFWIFRE